MLERTRRWVGRALLTVLAVVLAAAGIGAAWLAEGIEADPAAFAAVQADPRVVVSDEDGVLSLLPADVSPTRGVVFYPGARVEREAYAATWSPIVAETGIAVFIPGMPINLAVLDEDRVESVRAAHPEIDTWVLGGHSMGGFAALDRVVATGGDGFEGLILWAAGAPPRDEPVVLEIPVLTVAGELDDVIPLDAMERGGARLGERAALVVVPGMTHGQFGRYGASVVADGRSDEETLAELVTAVVDFLARVLGPGAA